MTGKKNIMKEITIIRWRWVGHVMLMENDITEIAIHWKREGQRSVRRAADT